MPTILDLVQESAEDDLGRYFPAAEAEGATIVCVHVRVHMSDGQKLANVIEIVLLELEFLIDALTQFEAIKQILVKDLRRYHSHRSP
jgi:hypothetical protein